MNQLSFEKRKQIIRSLCNGVGLRPTAEIVEVSFNSVLKLDPQLGVACQRFHNEKVQNVNSTRVEVDEIWNFVGAKQKVAHLTDNPEAGDAWTWVALDANSRLIVDWYVGKRDAPSAQIFMNNVKERLANRVQLTTDGLTKYPKAVEFAFGDEVDYAQLEKIYGKRINADGDIIDNRKQYVGAEKRVIVGNPDKKYVSTSYVERHNRTMRSCMRRFVRKTDGYSKTMANHKHAQALYFVYYNFVKIHQTLRVTPAMEAGLMNRWMEIDDIAAMLD